MRKKVFLFAVGILLAMTGRAQTQVWDGSTDTRWYDNNPSNSNFSISTAEELAGLAELVNNGNSFAGKTINLTANILLNDTTNWQDWATNNAGLNYWIPIGYSQSNHRPFSGTFNGTGHTVSGIYVQSSASSGYAYVGLFGYVEGNVTFKNVGITASCIRSLYFATAVGGLLGGAYEYGSHDFTITNCYNTATISSAGSQVGGLAGYLRFATIADCYNKGRVSGNSNSTVGGIVGNGSYGFFTNCYNTGTISGVKEVGGIAGYMYLSDGKATNCYNTGSISGESYVGGLFGMGSGELTDCYNMGTITAQRYQTGISGDIVIHVGGLLGYGFGDIANCYNTGEIVALDAKYVGGLSGSGGGNFINCYNTAAVTALDRVGGLIGCGDGNPNLTSSYNSGSVNGRTYTGGLVGYQQSEGKIDNSYNLATVTGSGDNIGGLVGYTAAGGNGLLIYNSYNRGNVVGADSQNGLLAGSSYVGGIVGYSSIDGSLTVHNTYNTGDVSGSDWIGGLGGYTESTTIRNCYNAGGVTGYSKLGGLIGEKAGGSVTYSYWRTDGAGSLAAATGSGTTSTGCEGKTTLALKSAEFAALLNSRARTMNVADAGHPYGYWATATGDVNKGYVLFGAASVNFDVNAEDATPVTPGYVVVSAGGTIATLPTTSREGYVFAGWNTKADATGDAFVASTPVNGHISVYAFWRKIVTIDLPTDVSKTYDGSTVIDVSWFNRVITNLEPEYPHVNAVATSANFNNKNAGTGKTITVNYTLESSHTEYDDTWRYIVYPQQLTGSIGALTLTHDVAVVQSRIYDGTDAAIFTGGLTNVVSGDNVSLNAVLKYNSADVNAATSVEAKTWAITGTDAENYVLPEFPPHSAYITAAPQSITFQPQTRLELSSNAYILSATATSGLPVAFRLSQSDEFASLSGNVLTLLKAGEIEVTAYVDFNPNYEYATEIPVTITIAGGDGINAISASDPIISTQYYTLQGVAVKYLQAGQLYIVKETRQSGKTTISKFVN